MSYSSVDSLIGISSATARLRGVGASRLQFPAKIDLCREQLPAAMDRDAMRFAAEAARSTSPQAFRPAFLPEDWRTFASFCVTRQLPAGFRMLVPGTTDRTLRFVVEGALWQESSVGNRNRVLAAGTIVGEDAVFSDAAGDLDVRALEDSLILELPLARQKELTASCPEIGFALLRAAGAVIAAGGRPSTTSDDEVAAN